VAVDGGAHAKGTKSDPFYYIADAIAAARPGDVVYLRGGTYGKERAACAGETQPSTAVFAIQDFNLAQGCSHSSSAVNGTASNPIRIKSYPGEKAVIDGSGLGAAIVVDDKSFWIIENLEVIHDNLAIWKEAHDITIQGNEFHNMDAGGGNNFGMVMVEDNRQAHGAYNIVVQDNTFHDSRDKVANVNWDQTLDALHFGAFTAMSCEDYDPYDPCLGPRNLTFQRNTVYNMPQAVFIKNPQPGPIKIKDNVVHDVQYVISIRGSNLEMSGNLFYRMTHKSVFYYVGGGGEVPGIQDDARVFADTAHNFNIHHNTFVGVNGIISFSNTGSGHKITNNVVYGLQSHAAGAGYDSSAMIERWNSYEPTCSLYNDSGNANVALSELGKDNDFNRNCLISPNSDFLVAKRMAWDYSKSALTPISFFTMAQAQQSFGFETQSVFVQHGTDTSDEAAIFTDPAHGDYTLRPDGPAANCLNTLDEVGWSQ
jgi:hypothetical protein